MGVQVQTLDTQQGYVVYTGAAAVVQPITGTLVILRDNQVVAEYPVGRFTTWAEVPDPPAPPAEADAPAPESESDAASADPAGADI